MMGQLIFILIFLIGPAEGSQISKKVDVPFNIDEEALGNSKTITVTNRDGLVVMARAERVGQGIHDDPKIYLQVSIDCDGPGGSKPKVLSVNHQAYGKIGRKLKDKLVLCSLEGMDADKYNVVAYNLRTLHDRIAQFTTLEAPGLIVRMDVTEAGIYGDRVVELLSEARQTLSEKYAFKLEQPKPAAPIQSSTSCRRQRTRRSVATR